MCEEKVKVVQIALAKLIIKIPLGYSRSSDKIREHLLQNTSTDVKQFLDPNNQLKYINPDKFTLSLKSPDEEVKEEVKTLVSD